jgi:hypothetical protein
MAFKKRNQDYSRTNDRPDQLAGKEAQGTRRLRTSSGSASFDGGTYMDNVKKVVLAYSGGLDTSILVKWLKEQYGCEVVAFTADVGQQDELDGLEAKAIKTGASKIYIEDLKEEFARDFVFFAIKANAIYEGTYLLGTSIARPLIAKRQGRTRSAMDPPARETIKCVLN